ncbi:MAG: T9SS type A sorting domain-containing protein [Aureispira sp.]|nr:T9SS type A sorting domain-containing protein [Aureispira sp.]
MKKNIQQFFILLTLIGFSQFALAQCANNNTNSGSNLTPSGVGSTATTTCIFGGEYATVNVVVGANYTFSTCGNTAFDTQISLYNDATGTSEGYNDDGCGLQSTITWTATFTGVLRVLVDRYNCSDQATCMTLNVTLNSMPIVSGTDCASAIATTCGSTVTGNTVGATPSPAGTCITTVGTGGAHWYTFTGDGNTWSVETVVPTGTQYDTKIWVFSGSCASLTCVTGDDDGGTSTLSLVNFATVAGTTYYVIVGGFGSAEGDYEMTFTNDLGCSACTPPAAPTGTDDYLCSTGTANLLSTTSGGTIEWYDAASGGNFLGSGTTYAPAVASTTTYYVQEVAGGGGAPTSITTLFAQNNGQSGIMFDITAINAVTINSFETNMGAAGDFEIYYKAGTHVGSETNAAAWTLVGSAAGVANNPANTATPIPIAVNTAIAAGQTGAFYVTYTTGTDMLYTDGTAVGNVYTSDANIQVKEGTGKAYAFGTNYSPRILNGIVHYTPGTTCASPRTPVTANVTLPPTAPATVDDNICFGGVGLPTASSTSGAGTPVLNWYTAATGGTAFGTGTSYTTPPLTNNATYYVEEEGASGSSSSLQTLFAQNNGQSGIMFDITAINAVNITSFETNMGAAGDFEIYYKTGTHVGSETNAGAWTLVGSAAGVTNNPANTATAIPIAVNTTIGAGQTGAFYITYTTGTDMLYTDGTAVGNVYTADANIQIKEGTGKAYPFGTNYSPRILNGIVHYTSASPCHSTRTPVDVNVSMPIYATTNTTTTANTTCTVNEAGVDWTYYYNSANPDDLLFAIAHDPTNLGNNTFTANVDITVNNNPTSTGYYLSEAQPQQTARFVMGRYWNVTLASGVLVDPVRIRFYYQPGEKTTIDNAATNWQATHGGTKSPIYVFKTDGVPFVPATSMYPAGVYNSLELQTYTDNLTTPNGTNYIQVDDVTSFSGGSIIVGVVPPGTTPSAQEVLLEVDITDYKVEKHQSSQAMIQWTSSNERNIAHYVIERSLDGVSFEDIGKQNASGTDAGDSYQFVDNAPLSGTNYYRIRIVDVDGQINYTTIEALTFEGQFEDQVIIKPNPFRGQLNVEFIAKETSQVEITVFNTVGEKVYQETHSVKVGKNEYPVAAEENWSPGAYIIQVKNDVNVTQRKVIKQ